MGIIRLFEIASTEVIDQPPTGSVLLYFSKSPLSSRPAAYCCHRLHRSHRVYPSHSSSLASGEKV